MSVQTDPVVASTDQSQYDEMGSMPDGVAEAVAEMAKVMFPALDANLHSHAFDGYDVEWEAVRYPPFLSISVFLCCWVSLHRVACRPCRLHRDVCVTDAALRCESTVSVHLVRVWRVFGSV